MGKECRSLKGTPIAMLPAMRSICGLALLWALALGYAPPAKAAQPSLIAHVQERIGAWHAHRKAAHEFSRYLHQHPTVKEIFNEEQQRETVGVARGTKWLSIGIAITNFSLALRGNPTNALVGAANLTAAGYAWANQRSKMAKARGTTIHRALKLAEIDPSLAPADGAVDRWLSAGLMRQGDLHP